MFSRLNRTAGRARTSVTSTCSTRNAPTNYTLRSADFVCQSRRSRATLTTVSTTTTKDHCTKRTGPVITSDDHGFWTSKQTWRRSVINTTRCLVGCTIGDFSAMWYLQSVHPELSMTLSMGLSMAAGITTSILLETALLHLGRDRLPLGVAVRTATGMSMISMLAMEAAENTVNYNLTGGLVEMGSPTFWAAAVVSALAGFLVPLPYNYFRLRAYRKSCH